MNEVTDQATPTTAPDCDDLVAAVQQVLRDSPEPLTLPKLRAQLPASQRSANIEECLRRQVAANVLYQYPKYRSQQDRFWDRPMPVHVAALVRDTLGGGPLGWSELRRKLPAYAQAQAEGVLQDLLARHEVHVHPRSAGRGSDRFGLQPPDARDYLRPELQALFQRLAPLGFTADQLRASALELLHEEEWSLTPPPAAATPEAEGAMTAPGSGNGPSGAAPGGAPLGSARTEPL